MGHNIQKDDLFTCGQLRQTQHQHTPHVWLQTVCALQKQRNSTHYNVLTVTFDVLMCGHVYVIIATLVLVTWSMWLLIDGWGEMIRSIKNVLALAVFTLFSISSLFPAVECKSNFQREEVSFDIVTCLIIKLWWLNQSTISELICL